MMIEAQGEDSYKQERERERWCGCERADGKGQVSMNKQAGGALGQHQVRQLMTASLDTHEQVARAMQCTVSSTVL